MWLVECVTLCSSQLATIEKKGINNGFNISHTCHCSRTDHVHGCLIAGTFSQQLGWVFVGPRHPVARGPPALWNSLNIFFYNSLKSFIFSKHNLLVEGLRYRLWHTHTHTHQSKAKCRVNADRTSQRTIVKDCERSFYTISTCKISFGHKL